MVFWIDAICINQWDHIERAQQVRLMGAIYKTTINCRVWLGEVDEEAIQTLKPHGSSSQAEARQFGRLVKDLKLTDPQPLQHGEKEEDATVDVPGAFEIIELMAQGKHLHEMPFFHLSPTEEGFELSEVWSKTLHSLENILRRSWWLRIWTIQEALLPRKSTVYVGPHSAPFSLFLDGIVAFNDHVYSYNVSSHKPYGTKQVAAETGLFASSIL
jgi:hypothetical protein